MKLTFFSKCCCISYLFQQSLTQIPLDKTACWQGKELYFLFPFRRRFRLCGGDQRAFRSPFGNLRGTPFEANGGPQVNWFLVDGREGSFLAFLCFAGFRLRGGDQRAFRSPFGNLRSPLLLKGTCKQFLVNGNEREPSLRFLFRGRQPSAPPQVVLSLS